MGYWKLATWRRQKLRRKEVIQLAHRVCDEGTACFIRNQAKKLGVSVEKVKREYSKESGIPEGTLDRWLYPSKSSPKTGGVLQRSISRAREAES